MAAVDDCGVRINPMIVEGQIHGGLTMGLAPALFEEISYDADGNICGGTFMDYLLPTAVETPHWETGETVTPSPHHPFGAKGVGESATVGAPAAIANAVVDALWHLGVRHIDIPITPPKVWALLKEKGAALFE
jgi:carbon-monoxide dehydrogenase large subunit